MNHGIKTFIYLVKDSARARTLFSTLLGVEPYVDEPYYVGYRVADQEIGLDPNGHTRGMTSPVGYWHVKDIRTSLQQLLDAGAKAQQEVTDVGGGRLIAVVKDTDSNMIGLLQTSRAGENVKTTREEYSLQPIGYIRSTLQSRKDAPKQGAEGAPDAWLDLEPAFTPGLLGLAPGNDVIVVTWLHRADRTVLEVHPRRNPANPLTGVFFTRSPDRPNPLGLHRVTVREISGHRLRIGPMEAIDGTPVVDIKAVLEPAER